MHTTPEFPDLLRLIDERAEAFRAAASSAPDLNAQVPTCPDWTLRDLIQHLGSVHRFWAGVVATGPADTQPIQEDDIEAAPRNRDALLAWSADSTALLLQKLHEAGPNSGCWTWWEAWQAPQTAAAVARHQVQEAAVHTYDAQNITKARPLPPETAVDGVEEFLTTCCTTTSPWPHHPATIDFHVTEGTWRLTLSDDGAHVSTLPTDKATVSTRSTAGELVLALYGRLPFDALTIDGDRRILDQLKDWEPDD